MPYETAFHAIADVIGDRPTRATAIGDQHGGGKAFHAAMPPDAFAFVDTAAEVQTIVQIASAHRVRIIAFGAGSSLEGNVAAPHGAGLVLDMRRIDRIIVVGAEDMDCTIEPGVTREALNRHLRDTGLFLPIDPGASATLGGMVATRASGTLCGDPRFFLHLKLESDPLEGPTMKRKRFTEEQIIGILREADAGAVVLDLRRKHGMSSATYNAWQAKYGRLEVSEANRLRSLEAENGKFNRLLAEAMLDNAGLKDLLSKNGDARRQARSGRASAGSSEGERGAGVPHCRSG